MAYQSKLSQIVIDCADLDAGLTFWGGALRRPAAQASTSTWSRWSGRRSARPA